MSEAVLLVDDDAAIRRMLARTLVAEGYDVGVESGGGGALAAIERSAPDLVVLDIGLPDIDGLAVCRRLRGKGLALPILMLTARDAVSDRVAGLDAGADDYLVKPFAPEELLARVRAPLRRGDCAAREADLLELLLRNPRRVISRSRALERVWGSTTAASPNVVDRYVSYLRRKLGEPELIRTVRGVGFVLDR